MKLTNDLSIWGLILDASWLVKFVLISLLFVSIVSWVIAFKRIKYLRLATRSAVEFEDRFWSGTDLGRLYVQTNTAPNTNSGQENIFRAGFKEFARLRQNKESDAESVMEGAQRVMRVALLREQEKLEAHLSFLATVGSTSPYLGLFGTVWGIMTSFLALANEKQATISVVAPHIAEALIATAMGLFAAIPAVIFYNRFSSQVDALLITYDTFSDEFSSILHRKAHQANVA
ncbi:MAG: protein TolQ [Pseudomonadales bacterium]|nr:protein TolQ [Pseudomonadales bacterium]